MAQEFFYTREEAFDVLRQYATPEGYVPLVRIHGVLLCLPPTEADVRWMYAKGRQHGFIDTSKPTDPRTEQLLAMDT